MTERADLKALQAENARLVALLESHGIAWRSTPTADPQQLTLAELENMHIHKTGALIRASVLLGALSQPTIMQTTLDRLDRYAKCIGLAFQIRDDILDVIGDPTTLGKATGTDRALDKPTYPALLGLEGSREHTRSLIQDALTSLEPFGPEAEALRWLAHYIAERVS